MELRTDSVSIAGASLDESFSLSTNAHVTSNAGPFLDFDIVIQDLVVSARLPTHLCSFVNPTARQCSMLLAWRAAALFAKNVSRSKGK